MGLLGLSPSLPLEQKLPEGRDLPRCRLRDKEASASIWEAKETPVGGWGSVTGKRRSKKAASLGAFQWELEGSPLGNTAME